MSNALKGMIAGLVATLVLTALMVVNSVTGLMPQVDLIRLLTSLGTLTAPAAWMDHFIVGVVVWGLLFAVYDDVAARPAPWAKGMIFGAFAWLVMMVGFMPLAGAGFFGAKIGVASQAGLLLLHLIYGIVLGATYGILGDLVPVKLAVSAADAPVPATDADKVALRGADYSFNDDLPSSSPSAKTVLIIFGSLVGFLALLVLAVEFRWVFGF